MKERTEFWNRCIEEMPSNLTSLILLKDNSIVFGSLSGEDNIYVSPCGICDESNRNWLKVTEVKAWAIIPDFDE